jgi:hypothetical protein
LKLFLHYENGCIKRGCSVHQIGGYQIGGYQIRIYQIVAFSNWQLIVCDPITWVGYQFGTLSIWSDQSVAVAFWFDQSDGIPPRGKKPRPRDAPKCDPCRGIKLSLKAADMTGTQAWLLSLLCFSKKCITFGEKS